VKIPTHYPSHLHFSDPYLEHFARGLLPYSHALFEGGILEENDASWSNVFFHCLTVALATDILVEALNQHGQNLDRDSLKIAAFLHDAYKRREVEKMNGQPKDIAILYKTDSESKGWLKKMGYPSNVIEQLDGIGNNVAKKIYFGEITDLGKRVLHYVDDVTREDQIVTMEERYRSLEDNSKYAAQNEWSKRIFRGLTLYQAKRVINKKTQEEIANLIGLKNPESLPEWINGQIEARQHAFSQGRIKA
jgi:HD superfamily phosphodiesterase